MRHFWIHLLVVISSVVAGCERAEQIAHYTVPKPPPLEAAPNGEDTDPHAGLAIPTRPTGEPTDRTLGAIVPTGEQGWFFKLTGPKDAVAAHAAAFTTFIESLHFTPQGQPQWTLPEGWRQRAGSQMRYATLALPSEGKPLEVSVIALPKTTDDQSYALVNINRWRSQLSLGPIAAEQLSKESTRLELPGTQAILVDLLGTSAPGSMGGAPFITGAGNGK